MGKRLLKTMMDTGMQTNRDFLNRQLLNKAARTKVDGKEFLAGTLNDLTQQKGNGRTWGYKHKQKAIPVGSTHNNRLRTSPAKFKTIFN